ncbi:murein hydrolase activator EnvC family protein [Sporosarcina ureilytica]|uniref:Peptidase M23 n=1 Tax=Sporosarcina ureilytica TaxID=298596 RepID=A0A1D8JKM8_9BACL|nr:peptidoglycan DD-metalloendopeptidase family protein [Sporosarcina ureilytica]AOV09252.1 peptidase M23 [Sporosarcina ureilytica]
MQKWMLSILIAILVLSSGIGNPQVLAASLKDMKDEKNAIELKKNTINQDIQSKKNEITTNQSKIESIQAQIAKLDAEVKETNAQITKLENEITQTTEEVEALRASIEDLEKKIQERDEVLRERVRAMQVNGGSVNYLDVLLGANSFTDFIDRVSTVATLMDADRTIMKEQAEDQKQLEEEKKLVEQKLEELQSNKSKLEGLKASLQSQKAEQDRLAAELKKEQEKLNSEKANLETELHEAHELSAALEREIRAEENRLAELARQAEIERKKREQAEAEARANANKGSSSNANTSNASQSSAGSAPAVSSGTWTRPAAGRISSEFGYRNISFASSNHRGIDVANSIGTPIVAAGDGVVGRTGVIGTYGNVIMITHSVNGKIYTTLYAHLSGINVSPGQVVSKGQVIGSMGNTGRSSGPHLHFEFHVGGWTGYGPSAVNPRSYVPF